MENTSNQTTDFWNKMIVNENEDSQIHENYSLPRWVSVTLLPLYVIATLISLVGNIAVCMLAVMKKRLSNTGNYFVLSLGLSDILMVILCVPFTVLANLVYLQWVFGDFLCPVVGYLQLSSVIQRSLVLIAAAADRHHAIWRPMRKHATKKTVKIITAAIWIVSLLIPIPTAKYSKLVSLKAGGSEKLCLEVWPWENGKFAYGIGMMVVTYAIPLIVLGFTYGHIVAIIGNKPPGERDALRDRRRMDVKRKTIKTMICVVLAYGLCWLPIHAITVAGDINPAIFDNMSVHVLWLFCHWIAVCNSAVNPIIYFCTKTAYQSALLETLTNQTYFDQDFELFTEIKSRIRTSLSVDVILFNKNVTSNKL